MTHSVSAMTLCVFRSASGYRHLTEDRVFRNGCVLTSSSDNSDDGISQNTFLCSSSAFFILYLLLQRREIAAMGYFAKVMDVKDPARFLYFRRRPQGDISFVTLTVTTHKTVSLSWLVLFPDG